MEEDLKDKGFLLPPTWVLKNTFYSTNSLLLGGISLKKINIAELFHPFILSLLRFMIFHLMT